MYEGPARPEDEMFVKIDAASFWDLVFHWRHSPIGDPFLKGDIGRYYKEKLLRADRELGQEEARRISNEVGFLRAVSLW